MIPLGPPKTIVEDPDEDLNGLEHSPLKAKAQGLRPESEETQLELELHDIVALVPELAEEKLESTEPLDVAPEGPTGEPKAPTALCKILRPTNRARTRAAFPQGSTAGEPCRPCWAR